jgi:aspartate racemase
MTTSRRKFLQSTIGVMPVASILKANLNSMPTKIFNMKSVGLIGGTSWHSTMDYYKYINQMVNEELGDKTNPPLLLLNLNQAEIHKLQNDDKWSLIADIYIEAAKKLQLAGADAIMFCANTPHKNYEIVQKNIDIPILHIADAIGKEAKKFEMGKVILLGTKFTMTEPFIRLRLKDKFGIDTIIPEQIFCEQLQNIISKELSMGIVNPESKISLINEINFLRSPQINGIILGCTELAMIIKQTDLAIPILDSTYLHASMGVDFLLH